MGCGCGVAAIGSRRVLPRSSSTGVGGLAFHPSEPLLAVKELKSRQIDCFRVDYACWGGGASPGSRWYGNAKVVLLGDTGVGKSGLGLVLSRQPYPPTDSTHGRKVWTVDSEEVEIPVGSADQGGAALGSRRAAWIPDDPSTSPQRGRGRPHCLRLAE